MKKKTSLIFFLIISILFAVSVKSVGAVDFEVRNKEGGLISSTGTNSKGNYELGQWAYSIFITYAILLILGVLYYKKKLPSLLEKPINFIFKFEISQKVSLLILCSLIVIFIIFKVGELQNPIEAGFGDYPLVSNDIKNFNIFSSLQNDMLNFRYILHHFSIQIFGNIRVFAFLESISLLIVTYFTTTIITKKRFAGIVSVVILLQSSLFLRYSVSVTEDNLWTLLYLFSVFTMYKKWYLSPASYVLSLFSKPLIAIYLPMTFFFIYRASIKNKKKLIISYLAVLIVLLAYMTFWNHDVSSFYFDEFRTGLLSFGLELSSDGLIIIFLLPLVIGLFLFSRKGIVQADSIMILLAGILWSSPILAGITIVTNQPYRLIPFVVFFAIGVGTLLSTRDMPPQNKKYVTNAVFAFTLTTVSMNMFFVIFPAIMSGVYRLEFG